MLLHLKKYFFLLGPFFLSSSLSPSLPLTDYTQPKVEMKIQNAVILLLALLIALSLKPYVLTIYSSCSISAEILKTNNNIN